MMSSQSFYREDAYGLYPRGPVRRDMGLQYVRVGTWPPGHIPGTV